MFSPSSPDFVDGDLDRLERLVATRTGIVFSESDVRRRARMGRVVADLARERNEGYGETLSRLLSFPSSVDELVPHVTIGETYFFRDVRAIEVFRDIALPALASGRRGGELRLWCAGCSSGEEAYTLSMVLSASPWARAFGKISILGTDINLRALEKARRALYGRWSLRGLDEEPLGRFFETSGEGGHVVRERYRSGVSFEFFNLVDPGPLPWQKGSVDAIFCRNVLIYFDGTTRAKVLDLFHKMLSPGGWLVVAPCEVPALGSSPFAPCHGGGVTLFVRGDGVSPPLSAVVAAPPPQEDLSRDLPTGFFPEGQGGLFFSEEAMGPIAGEEDHGPREGKEGAVDGGDLDGIRRLADEGRLDEALSLCLAGDDRSDPARYYLLSVIHQERGDFQAAQAALRRVLYLDPLSVAAHYSLGLLALGRGKKEEARRHFRHAADLLAQKAPEAVVEEVEGMTAMELRSLIAALSA